MNPLSNPVPGFRGRHFDLHTVAAPDRIESVGTASPSADLDLVDMARHAMNYLIHNPRPEFDYECIFTICPLACPPIPTGQADLGPGDFIIEHQSGDKVLVGTAHDPITWGDTDSRMDYVFPLMRLMSGLDTGRDVEQGLHRRIRSYIREDGLCWLPTGGLFRPGRDYALPWTAGWAMMRLAENWQRTGDENDKNLARKLFDGIHRLATRRDGRAWHDGGMNPWIDGVWHCENGADGWTRQPGLAWPVVDYWQVTKDPEALVFARELAEGVLHNDQPRLECHAIQPDGSFAGGNTHLVLHEVLGVAELGALTGEARYLDFARRVYEYVRLIGLDYGWFPEYRIHYGGDLDGETCNTADMVALAACLAEGGSPEYWDHTERYVRNYVRAAQFFVTPDLEPLIREANPEATASEIRQSLAILKTLEGGFNGCFAANSLLMPPHRGPLKHSMYMSGCCAPSGMYAIYRVWSRIVQETPNAVYINMSFNCEHPAARVVSYLPNQGRLSVVAKGPASKPFLIRVPAWADRGGVRAYKDGHSVPVVWDGPRQSYVRFEPLPPGVEMTVTYPLVRFRQEATIGGQSGEQTLTFEWLGNTLRRISPRTERLPLFP